MGDKEKKRLTEIQQSCESSTVSVASRPPIPLVLVHQKNNGLNNTRKAGNKEKEVAEDLLETSSREEKLMDRKPSLSKTVSGAQNRNAIQSNTSGESSTPKAEINQKPESSLSKTSTSKIQENKDIDLPKIGAVDTDLHKRIKSPHMNVIGMDKKEDHGKLFIEEEEETSGFPKTSPSQYKP